MADTRLYLQTQKFTLKTSISLSDTSIELSSFNLPDGTAITSGDLGSVNYATIAPGTDNEEQISFTGLSGTTLTGVTRGLSFDSPYTQDTNLRKAHAAGTILVLSNTSAFYNDFVNKGNDETMTGYLSVPTPTSGSHAVTKDYADALSAGGQIGYDKIVVAGDAGETIAEGELVYFDDTDNEWKLCDADTAGTVDDVIIGIAQGAGTDGNPITGGILLRGLDDNQTGLTVGVKLYVGNTAGAISETAGTTERVIGWSKSATEVYFDPAHATNPTSDQKAALSGDTTPSASNPYTTRNRTMTAGATINGATTPVPVYQNKTDNEFYACDANDTSALKFLGFAITNGTDGNDVEVQFTGVVSGFTGLSEGEKYYVQDTAGTIGTSPGTYEVLVGVAISTTELLIQKGTHYAQGATRAALDATGSEAITTGFRPSRIKVYIKREQVTDMAEGYCFYDNGAATYLWHYIYTADRGTGTSGGARIYDAHNGDYMNFTITSVTDTGFTITYTESGTFNETLVYQWEAEGHL